MKEEARLLIELQEIDSDIVRKMHLISAIPRKISSFEQILKEAELRYEKQKQKREALDKKRKEKERALDDIDERIRKLKARSSEIKSNKEYQAHLKEIASVEKERTAIEDEILVLMESVDTANKDLKGEETRVKAEKEKIEQFKGKLNEEAAAAQKSLNELRLRRAECVKHIDKELYKLYFKVLESIRGLAVVAAKDEICQGCYMNIPPQTFVELKKNERIIQCPQCSRILYWKGEAVSP